MSGSQRSKTAESILELLNTPIVLPDGSSVKSPKASRASPPSMTDAKEIIELSERLLPILNARPDFIDRKKRSVIPVPFVL